MQKLLSFFGLAAVVYLAVKGLRWLKLRLHEKKQLRELGEILRQRIDADLKDGTARFIPTVKILFRLETEWHGFPRGGYRLFGFATDKIHIQVNLGGRKKGFSGVEDRVGHLILLFLKEKEEKRFIVSSGFTYQ